MVDVDIVAGSSFCKLELLIQSHESQVDAAWLGAMTISLSTGVDLFQKAFPESNIHRFTGSISPSKFRSESRAESLRNADRLLNLISRWDTAFPKERFFPRFAGHGSSVQLYADNGKVYHSKALGIDSQAWSEMVRNFGRSFKNVAGKPTSIDQARSLKTGCKFYRRRV